MEDKNIGKPLAIAIMIGLLGTIGLFVAGVVWLILAILALF